MWAVVRRGVGGSGTSFFTGVSPFAVARHPTPRNEGWQLYVGSRTEAKGTRQTRGSPTHSRHYTKSGRKKSAGNLGRALSERLLQTDREVCVAELAATGED